MRTILPHLTVLAGAMLLLPLFAFGVPAAQKAIYEHPVEPKMTPELNLGKMNYEAYCASCHGKTARGTDKGPTFISRIYHPGHHSDGAFFVAAHNGARAHHWQFGNMEPVPEVNDSQLESIVIYVRAVQQANGVF
jgi:mono/diheme cytochrome c family protein